MRQSSIIKKIKSNLQYAHSATQLFGLRMGVSNLLCHLLHHDAETYYTKLVEVSWNRFMKDIPFDTDAITTLPMTNDGPIWVMWWQGLDGSEPEIIRACLDSIQRHANGRTVHLITKNTIDQYASIDSSIMRKVHEGKITLTTLSDIIRFAVLKEHGGIWMDATIYLTADLSDKIRHHTFYSIPNHQVSPLRNWTGYFMGGTQGNPLFSYMLQSFITLYTLTNHVPDYFMIDVMLSAAYTHIPQVRSMIDSVPENNLHRFFLAQHLRDAKITLPTDTYVYKLSYKNTKQYEGKENIYKEVTLGKL